MLSFINPIIKIFKQKHWLTAGDGLGREAIFLKKQSVKKVTCSNIWLSSFNKQKISEKVDNCIELDMNNPIMLNLNIDVILIKEALHHLDKPIYGFYKLLELCKKGIVLIEPHDTRCQNGLNDSIDNSFLLSSGDANDWESWGNYKYLFSIREFCKIAWALGLPHVLIRGLNDPAADLYEKPTDQDPDEEKYKRYLDRCQKLDKLGGSNKRPYNLIVCTILKEKLSNDERVELKDFIIIDNPSKVKMTEQDIYTWPNKAFHLEFC